MIDGIPNWPLYFYQKDIIEWIPLYDLSSVFQIGTCPKEGRTLEPVRSTE